MTKQPRQSLTSGDERPAGATPPPTEQPLSAAPTLRRRAEERLRAKAARSPESDEPLSGKATRQTLYELRVHQVELEMQNEELRRAQVELDVARARYFDLYDLAPVGYCTLSERGVISEANLTAARLLGVARGALVGQRMSRFILAADQDIFYLHRRQILAAGPPQTCDLRMLKPGGAPFWVRLESAAAPDCVGAPTIRIVISDISERKQAEAERHIAAVAFESQQGMLITDARRLILRVNRAFLEITGYTAEEVVGQPPTMLEPGRHDADFFRAMWKAIKNTGGWQGEVWDRRKNGEVYPTWLTISAVKGGNDVVTHYVGTLYDISARKKAEERIEDLAFYDSLTHLPNRTLLREHLKQAMTAGHRNGTFAALLFVDLDHFKTINDTLGHHQGDLLLQEVAQRLAATVRESDTVARLGGDEFVVILGNLHRNIDEAATQTEAVAEKILAALGQPYRLGEIDYHSTASIGATLFQGLQTVIDDLLRQADLAMYKTKAAGRNGLTFFDPSMQTVVFEHAALEMGLRRAIRENQFVLHYQAQVAASGRVTGCEVLVRWQHPERGLLLPAEFIPLAETTGLIVPLGYWVLEAACCQLAKWASQPQLAHLTMAVNVSAEQFREPDFVDQVLAILGQTGASPNRLELELTESVLVENADAMIGKMVQLKARGVGLALDDFGTGYSSLAYLKLLPLDQLKIDQCFVRGMLSDPTDAAIARTIVALAQSRALSVIAEGVETETQRSFLERSGCGVCQGYFFSRPLPLDEFESWVQRV